MKKKNGAAFMKQGRQRLSERSDGMGISQSSGDCLFSCCSFPRRFQWFRSFFRFPLRFLLFFLGFLGFPGSLPLVPLLHRFHADLADAHHGPTACAGQAAPDASPVAAVATSFELSLARAGIAWQGIPSRWTSWITLRAIASPALRDKFALPMAA